jgi:hypothetical protein
VEKDEGHCDLVMGEKQGLHDSKDSRVEGKMRTKSVQNPEYIR